MNKPRTGQAIAKSTWKNHGLDSTLKQPPPRSRTHYLPLHGLPLWTGTPVLVDRGSHYRLARPRVGRSGQLAAARPWKSVEKDLPARRAATNLVALRKALPSGWCASASMAPVGFRGSTVGGKSLSAQCHLGPNQPTPSHPSQPWATCGVMNVVFPGARWVGMPEPGPHQL